MSRNHLAVLDKWSEGRDQVYEAFVHWADAIIVSSPIRWGAASSLYFKMAERLNCVQSAVTIRNQVLIRNKVAGFYHRWYGDISLAPSESKHIRCKMASKMAR
jgi:multimeric flavodoxin WrbA